MRGRPVRSGASGYSAQQHLVAGHAVVEGVDEPLEERRAADAVVQSSRSVGSTLTVDGTVGPWPTDRHRRASSPPAIADYIAARTAPPDDVLARARSDRDARRLGDRRRMQVERRPGGAAHAAHPARRRSRRRRGRHVHRLLVDLHRPRPGARRAPAVLRRQRGVHGDRPARPGSSAGRRPTASSCASPRRSRRCGRCRPTRTIDLVFIDADKGGYVDYFDELVPRRPARRAAARRQHAVVGPGRRRRRDRRADTAAIKAFNDQVAADDRVESYILPVGDGLTLIRKR